MPDNIKAVILAAGQGKRLRAGESDLPKVMRRVGEAPLLGYVLKSLEFLGYENIIVVAGFGREHVIEYCKSVSPDIGIVIQERQLGTGNAVDVCRDSLSGFEGGLLVCYGDTPMVLGETYKNLLERHQAGGAACTMLSAIVPDPQGCGRITRSASGGFAGIVEQRDCTPEQKKIDEINTGIYVFDSKKLFSALGEVTADNAQNEYYLTDVPSILLGRGEPIDVMSTDEYWQILGINTLEQLDEAERIMREKGIINV